MDQHSRDGGGGSWAQNLVKTHHEAVQAVSSSTRVFQQERHFTNLSHGTSSNIGQGFTTTTSSKLLMDDEGLFKEAAELMKKRFEALSTNMTSMGGGQFMDSNIITTSTTTGVQQRSERVIVEGSQSVTTTSSSGSGSASQMVPTSKTLTNLKEITNGGHLPLARQPPKTSTSMNEMLLSSRSTQVNNFMSMSSSSSSNQVIPSFGENLGSPFRRAPFGFRNFDRPLWTDVKGLNTDGRLTWDPNALFTAFKASRGGFSASQQTFFESTNGNVRAFQDQRLTMRSSLFASESESSDDDVLELVKSKKGKKKDLKKAIAYRNKPAITFPSSPEKREGSTEVEIPPPPPSEIDDASTISDFDHSPRESVLVEEGGGGTPEHKRCFKVAQEFLTTERTYVRILHLIDQVFHFRVDHENRTQQMFPPEIVTQMFCNIKSLYKLHHDHLLPQLEKRLASWDEDPRIGDIMKEFAPFLKMYSEYVQNFDNSINLINVYREKNPRFAQIIQDTQGMEECANLPITHHLIGPIQRIPRYRLLLEAYLKRLPEDSLDRKDTEKALSEVSKAAEHANEAMRRIVSFKKLLEVQEKIKGVFDLVSPTRVFLKEGKIFKISARTGDHQERSIFLFSDILLLCSTRPMSMVRLSGAQTYTLRARLDVDQLIVNEGDDLEVVNTFYIQDKNKRIELYTETAEEKKAWMEAMFQARVDLIERKSSLRVGSPTDDELGSREPVKIKPDSVAKCMECHQPFSMLRRRQWCRACGSVICVKCSASKVSLPYAGDKQCRVCNTCRDIILKKAGESTPETSQDEEPLLQMHGVLDVPSSEDAVLKGFLNLRLRGKKDREWSVRWFMLRSDFVLYCYAGENADKAMTATPLPGLSVSMVDESKSEINLPPVERERAFKVINPHGRKTFIFQAPTRDEALTWVQTLQLASKAELTDRPAVLNNNDSS